MPSTRSAAVTAALLGAGLTVAVVPAHAEPLTCQGRPVTVAGTTGTDGDDVMVVGLIPVGTATSGAGNDLVCIRITTSQEPLLYGVDAGPGDDTVVNESTVGIRITTVLGAGADTYTGSDTTGDAEIVVAGAVGWSQRGDASDVEADTIDTRGGRDIVYSGSSIAGEKNRDAVSLGAGDDVLHWAGEQVGPAVDLGGGSNGLALYPGWQGTSAVVDAGESVATVDSRPALRWTGATTSFDLRLDNLETTFTGTDVAERLLASTAVAPSASGVLPPADPARRRRIDMGGGDDHVELRDTVGGTMIGGDGRDTLRAGSCLEADVRLGGTYSCLRSFAPRVEYAVTVDAWEDVTVPGDRVEVVGTAGPDTIHASGLHVRVRGRGGRDRLSATARRSTTGSDATTVVLAGGRGLDTLVGSFRADRLLGGPGSDRIDGSAGPDDIRGGAGHDRLRGGKGADRVVGGPGRDRTDGGPGRDRCASEVRRSCER